ncbi:hypothetical protein DFS34DRAFT_589111 [Phlyctochytrium arcticum]|nr:hypothetical protein DFS34DRAFT_589111 [Phlyctochytrium arcticum]
MADPNLSLLLPHPAHLPSSTSGSASPVSGGGPGTLFATVRKFLEADDLVDILNAFSNWKQMCLDLEMEQVERGLGDDATGTTIKQPVITTTTPYAAYTLMRKHTFHATHHLKDFYTKMEARFADARYTSAPSSPSSPSRHALISGAGPAGLRAAIELAFYRLPRITVLEKRESFSRANVMRIHAEDMDELVKEFGARDLYRRFSLQDRDVVAIRRMQIVLCKMALILGVESVEMTDIKSDPTTPFWTPIFSPTTTTLPHLPSPSFNILILATGEKSPLPTHFNFSRTEFRAGCATGITANFAPTSAPPPAHSESMQGGLVSYLNVPFFNKLKAAGLELENFANYHTDESQYLVMTPKRQTLLSQGVVREDRADPVALVQKDNVDRDKLREFARRVADHVGIDPSAPFLQMKGRDGTTRDDVAIFDFTGKTMATEASQLLSDTYNNSVPKHLLISLVGDALVEPFWPMGTGWARANGSCKLLGDVVFALGPDPRIWDTTAPQAKTVHEEGYKRLRSESYAPMTRVMS